MKLIKKAILYLCNFFLIMELINEENVGDVSANDDVCSSFGC